MVSNPSNKASGVERLISKKDQSLLNYIFSSNLLSCNFLHKLSSLQKAPTILTSKSSKAIQPTLAPSLRRDFGGGGETMPNGHIPEIKKRRFLFMEPALQILQLSLLKPFCLRKMKKH